MEFSEMLMSFGLTRQEASIYIALYTEGALTGYEVAKLCGISRSGSYTSLANLVEKGAAYVIEESASHYIPVDIGEFCENEIRKLKKLKAQLSQLSLPCQQQEGYVTIKGEQNILNKMINMILSSKERIYLSAQLSVLVSIKAYLAEMSAKGIKVVIITNPPFEFENAILYTAKQMLTQIRIITDSSEVLTGDFSETKTCLYSKNKNFVDLFKNAMKNEIKLIALGEL